MKVTHDEDIVLAKLAQLDEAIDRLERVVDARDELQTWIVDDLCALYVQRAVEVCIDIANHFIAENGWPTPDTASQAFQILNAHEIFDDEFTSTLISMVGFRNVAVHAYGTLDVEIVRTIVDDHLDDLRRFARRIVEVTIDGQKT